jgi:hypothetical protein
MRSLSVHGNGNPAEARTANRRTATATAVGSADGMPGRSGALCHGHRTTPARRR